MRKLWKMSSLIRVFTVCYSICTMWRYHNPLVRILVLTQPNECPKIWELYVNRLIIRLACFYICFEVSPSNPATLTSLNEKIKESLTRAVGFFNFHHLNHMSRIVRKPAFCICKNKSKSALRNRNSETDKRLCFRYTHSTTPLLPKSKISSL